ncbi:MAG: CPBP family intramembrane metalloprotease [Acidobacteria bacterium]|nr:CPBP family intramembrane metalloprotease [Acidobacteriota bacterium]
MSLDSLLRLVVPAVPAVAVALLVDVGTLRRGLAPPGFFSPGRRTLMASLVATVLYAGILSPLSWLDRLPEMVEAVPTVPELFLMHALLLLSVLFWFVLGFGPREHEGGGPLTAVFAQCGLRTENPGRDLRLGLAWGTVLWVLVVLAMVAVATALRGAGASSLSPEAVPESVLFMAGLPVALRVGLSVSAGFVEEVFFRGFLQPRTGIFVSSLLFILAHASYGQPLMLVGVTLLSLGFAQMVRVRGNVWPAVVAHTLFDALQLLWLIPLQVELTRQAAAPALGL